MKATDVINLIKEKINEQGDFEMEFTVIDPESGNGITLFPENICFYKNENNETYSKDGNVPTGFFEFNYGGTSFINL